MLQKIVGDRIQKPIAVIAQTLIRHRITPNLLTISGLIINCIGAYFYYRGYMVVGGITILFAGLFDMFDGALARAGDKASKIGGFMDSVVDRYSDFIIFGGVLAYFAKDGDFPMTILLVVIMCGAFLISYVRARAELVIPKCSVGLMERPERIIVLGAGSIFGFLNAALWFLAITTHITALHRIFYTHNASKALRQ